LPIAGGWEDIAPHAVEIDPVSVSGVRSDAMPSGKTKNPRAKGSANDGRAKSSLSKAAYVRALAHLSPKEIVEKARAEGIDLAVGYVYNLRSEHSARKRGMRANAAVGPKTHEARPPSESLESLLHAAAAEIGLGRAIEILSGERSKLGPLLGG
jgi:hypothetical protein